MMLLFSASEMNRWNREKLDGKHIKPCSRTDESAPEEAAA
jgi:hypothetical protein